MSRRRPLPKSFSYAFSGLKTAIRQEPNFRVHLVVAVIVMVVALLVGFGIYDWLFLLFTISFVLILELINTSLESIVDLVSPDFKEKAKIAKDVAASAVLLAAGLSIVVGIVLFTPYIS